MSFTTRYLTKNPCYKAGRVISVKGLMLHSVGCSQPNPMVFINSWDKESYGNACVHGFIGEDETFITLPCMETKGKATRGWHGASGPKGSCNNTHLGFEMCEPKQIKYTGGATFTCSDKDAAVAFVKKTTARAVELFAALCIFHGLDPLADGVIISHAEGNKRGIASAHADPDHLWRQLGMDYDMDTFRADVAESMNGKEDDDMTPEKLAELLPEAFAILAKKEAAPWAKEALDWCKENGYMVGDGTGNQQPMKPLLRQEAAQLIKNIMDR